MSEDGLNITQDLQVEKKVQKAIEGIKEKIEHIHYILILLAILSLYAAGLNTFEALKLFIT